MKRTIYLGLISILLIFNGCEKYDDPSISSPVVDAIEINQSIDIGFEIFTDAGYKSSTATADKGNAVVKTEIGNEAVQGFIFVTYTADSLPGKDYITFTLTDNNDDKAMIKQAINIIDSK